MYLNRMKQAGILIALLALPGTDGFAALNKWVDANGKVHYSDQPPPANVKAKTLRPTVSDEDSANTAASAPAAAKTVAEREAELKKAQQEKQAAAEKAAQEQEKAETRKANCEASQQSLRTLQSGMRLTELNAQGERVYLTDEQVKQRTERARQAVAANCD